MDDFDGPKPAPSKKQMAQMAARVFGHWRYVLGPDAETKSLGEGDPAELSGARGWNVVYRHGGSHVFALEGEATLWAVGPALDGSGVVAVRLEGE